MNLISSIINWSCMNETFSADPPACVSLRGVHQRHVPASRNSHNENTEEKKKRQSSLFDTDAIRRCKPFTFSLRRIQVPFPINVGC